jgi:hypothetical protein
MRRFSAAAFLTLFLAACSGPPEIAISCPSILRAIDTERVTRFADGPGRDITDVVLLAEVRHLTGECQVDDDEIRMTFPIAIKGERGPADRDAREDVGVFLHVFTKEREPLSRRELPFTIQFPGNRTSIVTSDTVTVEIPKTPEQTSDDFVIYLGLMLSREELAFNREERRR